MAAPPQSWCIHRSQRCGFASESPGEEQQQEEEEEEEEEAGDRARHAKATRGQRGRGSGVTALSPRGRSGDRGCNWGSERRKRRRWRGLEGKVGAEGVALTLSGRDRRCGISDVTSMAGRVGEPETGATKTS
ncbi:hypothetical protein HGM15179_017339 [Zosterops borbonicus]|uniref:Uncharacterized protein n=1 Tax=Zosterops borbonicus TaxID=364589 RepID=A0A8K1G1A5_9PASS|nr:hypothetical protein HGM15179_017339 [Zosterops borbonicus]